MVVRLEKKKGYLVKLVGFGRALRKGAHRVETELVPRNPMFIAPEAESESFADKQDAWACGVICLELISS